MLSKSLLVSFFLMQSVSVQINSDEILGIPVITTSPKDTDHLLQGMMIVPGSGNLDYDGNSTWIHKGSAYKKLANAIASRGYWVRRYQKKAVSGAGAPAATSASLPLETLADSVQKLVEVSIAENKFSCLWLIGHSEGAIVSLMAAHKSKRVCGLILIGAPGRPLGIILREQIEKVGLDENSKIEAERIIFAMEQGWDIQYSKNETMASLIFNSYSHENFASQINLDPSSLLSGYHHPILLIYGSKDVQMDYIDFQNLKNSNNNAESCEITNMNHFMLKTEESSYQAILRSYFDIGAIVPVDLVNCIDNFIQKNQKGFN